MFTLYGIYYERPVVQQVASSVLFVVVGTLVIVCTLVALRRLYYIHFLRRRLTVCLELTPSIHMAKSPLATEQLFNVIHGLDQTTSRMDHLLGRRTTMSLEIMSSKEQGIRFLAHIAATDRLSFEQNLESHAPDIRISVLKGSDFIPHNPLFKSRLMNFRQTGHFAFPLRIASELNEHDPISYLTGTMTKLAAGECMVFQFVLSPAPSHFSAPWIKKLQCNQNLQNAWHRNSTQRFLALALRLLIVLLTRAMFMVLSDGLAGEHRSHFSAPHVTSVSHADQLTLDSMHTKLRQPLFRVSIRALIVASDRQTIIQRRKGVRSAMTVFRIPKRQALAEYSKLHTALSALLHRGQFHKRLPSLLARHDALLSTMEIAALYHFPIHNEATTENMVRTLSRRLAAPLSLKSDAELSVVLGVNKYHGTSTPIGLTDAERERHTYIVGGTGNGKTTMLLGAIVQDMQRGKGVAVIDPHGDLAETILKHIPESRLNDVVYFNPDDLDYPLGLNLLEVPQHLTGSTLMRERDLVTESVISIFRKLFSDDDSGGHRVEYILRNAIQTALTLPNSTLFTVYELLNDPTYQKTVVRGLSDKNLRNFWWHELGRAGDYQKVKMAAGVTAKIGRFLFSASARQILEQPRSTIDFDDILATGKILICNVSKGRLGEDTATLFGTTILAKLQIATLRRARLVADERCPFYVYVDEFQNFATTSFVQMLSEARKYKLFLTMAEQSTSQQAEQRMVQIILANVGTLICFRTGNPADEVLLLPSFAPFVVAGEIANLPAYSFYARLASIHSQEPLSGETVVLETLGSDQIRAQVIAYSREQYVIPKPHSQTEELTVVEEETTLQSSGLSNTVFPVRLPE
jgi:hypothetical protein